MNESPEKREVSFQEAVDFANKFGLAGVIETSSKQDMEGAAANGQDHDAQSGQGHSDELESDFNSINDVFSICACKCVDETRRKYMELINARNAMIK